MSEHINEWSNDDPHVPLQFNEDGLVTKIGHDQGGSYVYKEKPKIEEYDTCVVCGKTSPYKVQTHIDYRIGYVEGAGQGCFQPKECLQSNSGLDYQNKVMKYRTTLITITAEDIIDTPNDMALGAKVRKKMWEVMDFKNQYIKEGGWIFESPDKGKTIYKRKIGETERTLSNKEDFKNLSSKYQIDSEGFEKDEWVCSLCGKSTHDIDYDYLVGSDHLSCLIQKENNG